MSDELKIALKAAQKGAEYALKFFGKEIKIYKKNDSSVFTHVDKATEEIIKNTILSEFPNAKFVGEEKGGIPGKGTFWTIDPIDGTRYLIRDTPLWSVLISLVVDQKPAIGVSNVACLDEIIYAEKGKGTFLNGRKITVSKISVLKDSMLMLGSLRFFKEKMPISLKLGESCASIRSLCFSLRIQFAC